MSRTKKIVFEGVVEYDAEDGGQALIATINERVPPSEDQENGMFVRLQSWQNANEEQDFVAGEEHKEAWPLQGKRVRITVEEI